MSNEKLDQIEVKLDRLAKILLFQKAILNFDEAVTYTGYSKSYLYRIINKIKHSKPSGKMIFFARKDLDDFLLSNKIKSQQELDDQANNYMMNKPRK
ncbi:helix-turn-helix domain-containing protein [Labilibaculum manganireducens]|uniref:helix-turn-helix domain-containing protein n=1 Tax=Labilibaculum manganireducens TaxID=1940525 RepID=UPI0029F53930|nr:helix-turn-helix domain-containing protein [Labilibaculum manganireducens]